MHYSISKHPSEDEITRPAMIPRALGIQARMWSGYYPHHDTNFLSIFSIEFELHISGITDIVASASSFILATAARAITLSVCLHLEEDALLFTRITKIILGRIIEIRSWQTDVGSIIWDDKKSLVLANGPLLEKGKYVHEWIKEGMMFIVLTFLWNAFKWLFCHKPLLIIWICTVRLISDMYCS